MCGFHCLVSVDTDDFVMDNFCSNETTATCPRMKRNLCSFV